MHVSCLDGPYKLSITCQHRNSHVPSADEIRMLILYVLRQITLTAAVTVKIVLHYNNVQIEVKEVYISIFNEKCHPPPAP